jgi:hypothetical protein
MTVPLFFNISEIHCLTDSQPTLFCKICEKHTENKQNTTARNKSIEAQLAFAFARKKSMYAQHVFTLLKEKICMLNIFLAVLLSF